MQFLSEPTGGSDLAGCLTRATRDGDVFDPQRLQDLELGRLPVATTPCAWPAPTGTCPSTAASPCSSSRSTSPASRSSRSSMVDGIDGVLPGVLRRRAHPGRATWSARSTTAGRWRPGCSSTSATRSAAARPTPAGRPGRPAAQGAAQLDLVELARPDGPGRRPARPPAGGRGRRSLDVVQGQLVDRVTTGHAHRAPSRAGRRPAPAVRRRPTASGATDIGLEIAGAGAVAWADERRAPAQFGEQFLLPPGRLPGRRQQRDAAQHHQRAGPRHAPGARRRPRPAVQPGPAQPDADPEGLS